MKVLLVEDTEKLAVLIAENLRMTGYVIDTVGTAEEALHLAEVEKYDIIILDRMLPGGQDGLDICERLRSQGYSTPILMLTALGGIDQKVDGFEKGADDYLAKPFDMRELLVRVAALTRRHADTPVTAPLVIGEIVINLSRKQVTVGQEEIRLSKRLWALLEYLALHQGKAISKETLIDHVWGLDRDVLENTVEAAIRKLRQRLGDDKGNIVQTVHGFGYRLKS